MQKKKFVVKLDNEALGIHYFFPHTDFFLKALINYSKDTQKRKNKCTATALRKMAYHRKPMRCKS